MNYSIDTELDFSEILTLDAALNRYYHAQLCSLQDYADHPEIITEVEHELKNVKHLIEHVEKVMFEDKHD